MDTEIAVGEALLPAAGATTLRLFMSTSVAASVKRRAPEAASPLRVEPEARVFDAVEPCVPGDWIARVPDVSRTSRDPPVTFPACGSRGPPVWSCQYGLSC